MKLTLTIEMGGDHPSTSLAFQSGADMEEARALPSGGLVHVAHGVFVEALIQESYLLALVQLSQGRDPKSLSADEIHKLTQLQVTTLAEQLGLGCAQAALGRIQRSP